MMGIDSTLMILQTRLKAKPDQPEIRSLKIMAIYPRCNVLLVL
jgi:hypothetical protein